jgi:hypothetical protein
MKKFLSTLCATALAASVTVTGMLPAGAAPVYVPKAPTVQPQSDVIQVQDYRWKRRFNRNRAIFDNDRIIRRGDFRRFEGRRAFRRFDDGPRVSWYNGHRGYRYRRHRDDRFHDGFWFPAAAFLTGAIIGGAIARDRVYVGGGGSAHVEWCYDRYRSYRAYDNTWQPYYGPRRQCISPYI